MTPTSRRKSGRYLRGAWTKYPRSVGSVFPRWWRLGLACMEVVLAAGLIVAAVTDGGWYWWAGAVAAAALALTTCPGTCAPSVSGVDHLIRSLRPRSEAVQ